MAPTLPQDPGITEPGSCRFYVAQTHGHGYHLVMHKKRFLAGAIILYLCSAVASKSAIAQETRPSTEPGAHPIVAAKNVTQDVVLYTRLTAEQIKVFRATILPNILEKTDKAWLPLVPEEARPPQSKVGSVRIDLTLAADGRPRRLLLQEPSGDIVLDRAAWGAITNAHYAPFPQGFDLPAIQMAYIFNYNNQGSPQANATKPRQ